MQCQKCKKEFEVASYITKELKAGGWTRRISDPVCPFCHEKLYQAPDTE